MPAFLCPICFTTHTRAGTCPHCGSEAIDVDVVPLADFLKRVTVKDLEDLSAKWREVTGFFEDYKAAKQNRIEKLLKRRRALELRS